MPLKRHWTNISSNFMLLYGSYERLMDDGLTQWHPAFLALGNSLDECARKYRGFCLRYKPGAKKATQSHWGSKLLSGWKSFFYSRQTTNKPSTPLRARVRQVSKSQQVAEVAQQFIQANRAAGEVEKEF